MPTPPNTRNASRPGSARPSGNAASFAPIDPMKVLRKYYPVIIILMVFGGGVGLGSFFLLRQVAPKFTARVVFNIGEKIEEPGSLKTINEDQDQFERFVNTQIAIMKSEQVLTEALKNPNLLQSNWCKPFIKNGGLKKFEAIEHMQESVGATTPPQSDSIVLTFSAPTKNDAAAFATGIQKSYIEILTDEARAKLSDRRQALSDQITSLSENITLLTASREQLVNDNQIDAIQGRESLLRSQGENLTALLIANEQEIAISRSLLERYQAIDELGDAAVMPDDVVAMAQNQPELLQIKSEISTLHSSDDSLASIGYGPNHPERKFLRARIESNEARYDEQLVRAQRDLFYAQIEMAAQALAGYEAVQKDLTESQTKLLQRRQSLVNVLNQIEQITKVIDRDTETLSERQAELANLDSMQNLEAYRRISVRNAASTPERLSFPYPPKVMIALGVFVFGALASAVVVLLELLNKKIRGPQDISLIPGLRLLGVVPNAFDVPGKSKQIATSVRDMPSGVLAEHFRQIKAPIIKEMNEHGCQSILLVPAMPGSGATTAAINLALSCCASRERTLLIDANFRRPGVHSGLGINNTLGLADVLADQTTLEEAIQVQGNLHTLTAGTAEQRAHAELLSRPLFGELVENAKANYDRIIIDCSPTIVSGDAQAVAQVADVSVVVAMAMRDKRGLLARLRNVLMGSRSHFMGVILNGVRPAAGGYFKRNMKVQNAYRDNAA